jgi:sodium pump decarboxylase gamma subunit
MKEKLSLILCLVAMAFGLTACGTDSANTEYYGTTYEELQSASENNIATLAALSDEEYEYYISYGSDLTATLVSSWREATADLGAYEGMGEFTVSKAQTTVTTEQTVYFEKRDVILTFVYEYSYEDEQLELEDANADLVYTMGEKMSKAGLNTLMGMGTVFCVLILISLVIYCFRFISAAQNRSKANAPEAPKQSAAPAAAPAVQPKLTDDSELVAAIMAAIAASTGQSEDSFIVRSIVRR